MAIAIGGPGATFWMIVCGLIGMSTKFVECTLGVKYSDVGSDGTVYGGPMYYLSKGLKEGGYEKFGKGLAVFLPFYVLVHHLEVETLHNQIKLLFRLHQL